MWLGRDASREELIEWVERYLDGAVGLIEASREIWRIAEDLGLDPELATFFRGVDSETDHLPVGEDRLRWNADALVAKDKEVAEYEEQSKVEARERCGSLLWVLRALPRENVQSEKSEQRPVDQK